MIIEDKVSMYKSIEVRKLNTILNNKQQTIDDDELVKLLVEETTN